MLPSSAGEVIVQSLCDTLNTPPAPPAGSGAAQLVAPCKTYRTRIDAFGSKELPAMVIYAVKEAVVTASSNTVKRTRTVRLEVMVMGEPPADTIVDPLYVFAIKTFDLIDNKAIGMRRLAEASIQWETEASYQDACIAVIDFDVVYATLAGDPTQLVNS
jgi:hypothetical protein